MRKALPDKMFAAADQSRITTLRDWVLENEVTEIEALLMTDLRDCEGCEHVERIVVMPIFGDEDGANWTVKCFNRGRSNGATCDRALQEIVPRLQGFYELVQKH